MAGKDIDLVIRAKDRASGELDKISKALKKNVEDQLDLAKGAGKTSAALGKLATDAGKFQTELNKLQSAGKIAAELDKATSAVVRMEGSLRSNATELAKLARESDAAAQATNRLKAQLAAEESNLSANKNALSQSKAKLSDLATEIRNVEAAQRALNATRSKQVSGNIASAGVGKEAGAPVNSARQSAGVFLAADLANAKAAQAQVNAEIKEYEGDVKQATDAIKALRPQVSAASSLQNQLASETQKASAALVAERDDVGKARAELATVQQVAQQASASLGGVAISQDAVSKAAQRATENVARVQKALSAYSKFDAGGVGVATPKAAADIQKQAAAVQAAENDWRSLTAEAARLNGVLRNTSGNATSQVNAFDNVVQAARLAKAEYVAQVHALDELRAKAGLTASGLISLGRSQEQSARLANVQAEASKKASSSLAPIAPALRDSGVSASDAANKTSLFSQALANVGKDSRQTLSLMQRLRGEILSLTASYIGFQAALGQIGGALSSYQQLEATQSRLGAVFNQDTGKVATEIQFLQQQADRLGISFGTLADEYGKFTVAAKTANFTTEDTRKIFISVAEAARVNRLSTEQTSGVFLALTQMISKGKVASEELRRQLGDRLTGAFSIFAAAIGKTTAELDEMMSKGEVLADRSTLLKFADQLSQRFGPQLAASLNSVSADLGRFQNDIFNAQIALANGFIPSLRAALQSFDEFAKSTEGHDTFRNIGAAVGNLIQILAEIPKYFDLITFAAKGFIAVKISGFLTELLAKSVRTGASLVSLGRQMTATGTAAQSTAQMQNFLVKGLNQTVVGLGLYQNALVASTSKTALARAGVLTLATAAGALRSALIVTATAAQGLLNAFGGPIGIAITAITFAVGSWLTSVDKASAAVAEHKRQVDIVTAAYNNAGDKAGDWAKKISGVTLSQAVASLEDLKKQFKDTAGEADKLSRLLVYAYQDFPSASPQVQQLNQLRDAIKGVQEGTTTIKQFEDVLNGIALNPSDDQLKNIALQILNIVNNAGEGQTSLKDLSESIASAEAQVRLMSGTATDADKSLLGLGKTAQETAQTLDYQGKVTEFDKLLVKLQEHIPGVGEELKKLETLQGLEKQYKDALNLATTMGQVLQATKAYSDAVAGVNTAFMQKQFDSLPDTRKSLIDRIIYTEGGQNGGGPSTSSARGIGQFTESTWIPIFNDLFPALKQLSDSAKLQYRANEAFARPVLEEFTKRNQMQLANAGVAPTDANTYLAHFLGASDAIKVILANPDELAKNIVNADSVKANPTVFKEGTTARDLQNWALQRIGGGSPIMAGGQTKQEAFDENIAGRTKAWKEEADARKESNREGVIAKAIAEAENEATKQGVMLTQAQRDAIREAAGAKYDSAHADEQLKKNQADARDQLNDIIGLDQQRKTLLQEINMAQNAGDSGKSAELQDQLKGINAQLAEAIPKALELARALGDEKMVAQLQKVQLNTAKVGQQFSLFGLSFNQTKQLAGNFADGLVGAFDSFAQSIAQGKDAVTALKDAFLQFAADFLRQIATMILKQLIFNALNSIFPGLGLGIGAAHTGGLVGSSATGGGNVTRQVSPMWFQNAVRYHSGGIAGLRPDEVPAVLKKNEEVITEQDPRHRFNSSKDKSSGSSGGQPIKQVLVLDQKDLANAVASSHGQQVVITHIKNNAPTIRKILGV